MTRPAWWNSFSQVFSVAASKSSPRPIRSRPASGLAAELRLLESRTLLSGMVAEPATSASANVPASTDEIDHGAVIVHTRTDASQVRTLSAEEGGIRPDAQLSGNGLQFNLVAASGMSQQAIDGFHAAADLWSSILRDDIMVNIDINFTALGTGILGSTGSTSQGITLTNVRSALTSDAKSLSDATAVANLPSGSTFSIYTSNPNTGAAELDNNSTANNTTLDVNTANAKAMGVRSASDAASDGSITFSNLFTWDFDRSNGITSGAYDFVGVAAHEIGHLLGFVSGADVVDYYSGNGSGGPQSLDPYRVSTTLDLFRFSAASETAGANIDMRADTATKYFSIDGGGTQITTYSTGVDNGDGRQCSHWKDNLDIGIMDPTAANGEYTDITNLDVQAFDVIGWDVAMDQGDAPDTGSGSAIGNYSTNLSDNGPRHLLFSASGNINDPAGSPKVYLGASVNGELSALQNSTATGDVDNGISSIPTLTPGQVQNITVNSTGSNAVLNYFVDFNRNGSFADAGESFTTTLTSTSQSVSVTVPAGASVGTTFARFRISTAGGLSSVGAANDGEVEDYQVTIDAGNTTPTLGGAVANQAVNDNATVSPFNSFTVTDPDTQAMSAIVRIQDGVQRGDFSAGTTGWTRTTVGNHIEYSRTFDSAANIGATVQAAIRSLVFQPRQNAITPGTTETTAFTVTVTDGVASPVINSSTSVITTSVNNAPAISGAVSNQAVNDNATITPFSAMTVSDPDTQEMSAIVRINNGVVRGDFTGASTTGWTRSVSGNDIQYSRSFTAGANIGGTVQSAIRALVFDPRENAIKPNTTETTTFNVTVTDGVAAPVTNTTTSVITTSINDAPGIIGSPSYGSTDAASSNPFMSVTVNDLDFQEGLAKVTILNGIFRGDFTNAVSNGWTRTVLGNDINYARYFSPTTNIGGNVQSAFAFLSFQPRQNAINPGTTEATDFLISLSDGVAAPAVNQTTRLTVTSTNDGPNIGGAVGNQPMTDFDTILPFSTLTVTDPDTQAANARVTIVNGVVRGDFTNGIGAGWTRTFNGNDIVYTRVFSAGSNIGGTVQAAIRALRYQPRQNVLRPGLSETTAFSVFVNDGLANTTNATTSVVSTSSNDAPGITGAVANQPVNDNATIQPFSTLVVQDLDTQDMLARVTIPNGVNRGDFTPASAVGWTRTVVGIDYRYERYFSPASNIGASVQSAIRALVFQPRNNVPIGTTETTGFTVFVNDGSGSSATNSSASVLTTGVAPRAAAQTIAFDGDIDTVVVPTVKSATINGLARLLKKGKSWS